MCVWPCYMACGILFFWQRIKPSPQQWKHQVLTTGPPRSPLDYVDWWGPSILFSFFWISVHYFCHYWGRGVKIPNYVCVLTHFNHVSRLTLWDPMHCCPPGSSVQEILQISILEGVAMSSFRGSYRPTDRTWICLHLPLWQEGSLPLAPPGKPNIQTIIIIYCPFLLSILSDFTSSTVFWISVVWWIYI